MRISHFFIDRPIFASVVSIIFLILGGVAFFRLPIAQYPEIAPPTITVSGQYPGASADVVAQTVVTPIVRTSSGKRGCATATRFCTCTCAVSRLVPMSKVTEMVKLPSPVEFDDM